MDPFSITTSVTKITSACLVTGRTIYDLASKYQNAPRNLVAISSELAVVSASLSRIQALVLSKQHPELLLRTRPEIAATLDTALIGCMVLFSCLDNEIKEVAETACGVEAPSWKGKMKMVWKHDTFQELLDGIRGQQSAINTLIQLLQMDSLLEITQLLQRNAPVLRKSAERIQSLRRSHPEVNVAESIYPEDDRRSLYSTRDSVLAVSVMDFEFDDVLVNSKAYRRVLATAKRQALVQHGEVYDTCESLLNVSALRQRFSNHSIKENANMPARGYSKTARLTMSAVPVLECKNPETKPAYQHYEHFSCSACLRKFGLRDSYYEHFAECFCYDCYCKDYARSCYGCELPILKNYAESFTDGASRCWHPECYLLYQNWGLKPKTSFTTDKSMCVTSKMGQHFAPLRQNHDRLMTVINRVWTSFSTFEEKLSAGIYDIMLHAYRNDYERSVRSAAVFLSLLGSLFTALESHHGKRSPKSSAVTTTTTNTIHTVMCIYNTCIVLFAMIYGTPTDRSQQLQVTQNLSTTATNLAYLLKMLVKIAIAASISAPEPFIDRMRAQNSMEDLDYYKSSRYLHDDSAYACEICHKNIAEESCLWDSQSLEADCLQWWHASCLTCPDCSRNAAYVSKGPSHGVSIHPTCRRCGTLRNTKYKIVSKLTQYRHLLWITLARRMDAMNMDFAVLQNVPFDRDDEHVERREATHAGYLIKIQGLRACDPDALMTLPVV